MSCKEKSASSVRKYHLPCYERKVMEKPLFLLRSLLPLDTVVWGYVEAVAAILRPWERSLRKKANSRRTVEQEEGKSQGLQWCQLHPVPILGHDLLNFFLITQKCLYSPSHYLLSILLPEAKSILLDTKILSLTKLYWSPLNFSTRLDFWASMFTSALSSLSKNPLRWFPRMPILAIWLPSISNWVPPPPPFPRWCLVTLACLQQQESC